MKKLTIIVLTWVFTLNGLTAQNEIQEFSEDSISVVALSYVNKFNKKEKFLALTNFT